MSSKEFHFESHIVRRDLQSRRIEYQDLQSENRIINASSNKVMFVGICNPDALNIRIFNPQIALKMLLILHVGGLEIHLSVRIAEE